MSAAFLELSGPFSHLIKLEIDGAMVALPNEANYLTADANGVWSYTPVGLSEGTHTVVAHGYTLGPHATVSAVGSASLTFTLDTHLTTQVNILSGAQSADIRTLMSKVAVGLEHVREQKEHDMAWAGASDIAATTALLHAETDDPHSVLVGLKNADARVSAHA